MNTDPDSFIEAVLAKTETLLKVNFWPPDSVRARAWLGNFEEAERLPAAVIMDNLIFYSNRNTSAPAGCVPKLIGRVRLGGERSESTRNRHFLPARRRASESIGLGEPFLSQGTAGAGDPRGAHGRAS
jgi:hypothetical protein